MRRFISVVLSTLVAFGPQLALGDDPPADAPPPAPSAGPAEPPPPVDVSPERTAEEALATELFTAARELMAAGRHAEACPKLVESARLSKKVGTYGKLAECDEKMGRLVAARADFQQALNLARALGDERLPIVERELARVDAVVPRLLLSMSGPAPQGLAITVDGVDVGAGLLGTPIPLDPGRHEVVVTLPGKQPWREHVELAADGKTTPLLVPSLGEPARAAPAPEPPAPAGRSPLALGGIVAAGVGAVGLGVGAFFGGLAQAKTDESNRTGCDGNECTPHAAKIRNDARAAGDVSTALFVAGGAVLAGGLTLWLVGTEPRSAPASAAPPPRVGLRVSLDTVSIQGSF